MVVGGEEPLYEFSQPCEYDDSFLGNMMARDVNSYLVDDILAKVDRAAMSVALETRVPLLCQDVVATAWSMHPSGMNEDGNATKQPIRTLLYKRVPRHLIERPKSGFAIPLGDWLKGPLKEWTNDLLDVSLLRRQGLINVDRVEKMKREHFSAETDHQYRLWNVLMFQSWLSEYQQ